ncbi:hypothetical protein DFQ09_102161 [Winogradskyella pacifica]|uniref:Uncharacterized protein n=2 Tax=Winogradskyella pacifica TaxID=664642 RepID=A0A3D9MZ54_9FLAO|nr:hypothetical protein DFQ09_102161 [Winogradskyella pacifica]
MFIASGFSSSSKLDFSLSAVSTTTDHDVATICFNSTLVATTENLSYLNKRINIDQNYAPLYFQNNITTYITHNHILKQS